jgi:hypothetical protein
MEVMLLSQCHVPSNIRNNQLIFQLAHWTRVNASAVPGKNGIQNLSIDK